MLDLTALTVAIEKRVKAHTSSRVVTSFLPLARRRTPLPPFGRQRGSRPLSDIRSLRSNRGRVAAGRRRTPSPFEAGAPASRPPRYEAVGKTDRPRSDARGGFALSIHQDALGEDRLCNRMPGGPREVLLNPKSDSTARNSRVNKTD